MNTCTRSFNFAALIALFSMMVTRTKTELIIAYSEYISEIISTHVLTHGDLKRLHTGHEQKTTRDLLHEMNVILGTNVANEIDNFKYSGLSWQESLAPYIWYFLHVMALRIKWRTLNGQIVFIYIIETMIICSNCRRNFTTKERRILLEELHKGIPLDIILLNFHSRMNPPGPSDNYKEMYEKIYRNILRPKLLPYIDETLQQSKSSKGRIT